MEQTLTNFKKGPQYIELVSKVTEEELTNLNDIDVDLNNYTMIKFIPASGAATRMFSDLYIYIENQKNTKFIENFFTHLEEFAFYDKLSKYLPLDKMNFDHPKDRVTIIQTLLNYEMRFGELPKALIPFHKNGDKIITPIDEHIYEGERYLNPDKVKLHFTISKEHEDLFNKYIDMETVGQDYIDITYSLQNSHTNTLAVDFNNDPFKLDNGELLYRPGGHGSLIDNLNNLDEDIIFIKNVDNVCHRSQIEDTIKSKKKLAITGIQVKEQIDSYLLDLAVNNYCLDEIVNFIQEVLNIKLKTEWTKEKAFSFLNRPLRVCGVVKNEGESGGGPYVVDNGDYTDLQICEKLEINLEDPKQKEISNKSEFFNPVDIVCFTTDYKGDHFNLLNFTNKDRYFISEKTYKGRPLKALEHPGLWNGAMHNWNTIFVEVPLSTFNPVKTVNDLLKKGHRAKDRVLSN